MKHITRFFGILGLFLSLSAQAQFSAPTLSGTTDTVYIDLDTLGAAGVVAVYWDVLNGTEEALDLMVTRTLVDTVSPFNYPFETDASPAIPGFFVTLEPGDTTDTFVSDFYPNGVTGTTTLQYCFHQDGPPSLGACHELTFVVTGSVDAVTSPAHAKTGIAQMMPNPASDAVQIRFENARDGVIEFRNLVGQVGRAEKVQAGATLQRLDLDGMADGIWLVSYKVEGVAVSTKRLVIR